jgi:hypothetical protein
MSLIEYDESVESLKESFNSFTEMADGGKDGRGSKTKALQARKLSMAISDQLKNFRALSISNDKAK